MRSITAVELGTDICALARTSVRGGEICLTAAAFPGVEAFTLAVRQTRRSLGLPRRCRVVVWGLPDGASRRDAAVKPLIEPLVAAGFRIERVVSPCNALAALARRMKTSRGEGSTCWIGINRGGVAIVVVRPGKLLYSHSFAWDSSIGSSGSQARLLQRYSLVSFLSPELKRAIAESRKFGTPVDAVVTCGNLPDLRSLTMPLIEELDVEVETLDSLEGLVVSPPVAEKLAEWAPAIRLACAATIARGTRPWDPSKKPAAWNTAGTFVRAAGLAAALAGIGYLLYMNPGTFKRTPASRAVVSAPGKGPKSTPPASVVAAKKSTPPAVVNVPAPATKPTLPAVSDSVKRAESNPPAVSAPPSAPKSNPPPVNTPTSAVRSSPPALNPTVPAADKRATGVSAGTSFPAAPVAPTATGVRTASTVQRRPVPAPLRDAVPRVTAILVASDRRFATVDGGRIIGIGDLLGRRKVIGMDERSVVLQEPSGVQVRIGLGGRLLGIERSAR
jgi:hypothetical protein